jgi:hypothetical protein
MDSKAHPMTGANPDQWPAFVMPWNDATPGPTDMSWLLEKPAGAHGFITSRDGHFATGDGRRWRAWGVVICGEAAVPRMDEAPVIARRLAKFGVNCLRLHHIDHRFPDGILIRHSSGKRIPAISVDGVCYRDDEPTRALDPEGMARFDWLVYHCKLNGIYINMGLYVSRPFSSADGVREADQIGLSKGIIYWDDQMIRLQKEFAHQFLTHVNPYTGNSYANEPALAMIELCNESSVTLAWQGGMLTPPSANDPGGKWWVRIPPSYAADLDRRWNAWLACHYASRAELVQAWQGDLCETEDPSLGSVRRLSPPEFAQANRQRFLDEATFLSEIERSYYRDMESFLRGECGARQMMMGTADCAGGQQGMLPLIAANAALGMTDGHAYWQLPNPPISDRPWGMLPLKNTPMVDDPDRSLPARLSRTAVAGLPHIIGEVYEPFPHDYGCEAIPIMAAYGLLQDWDGIFWCKYRGHYHFGRLWGPGPYWPWDHHAIGAFLSMVNDPMRLSQLAVSGLMWHRGDVQAAKMVVERSVPHEWALESQRNATPDAGFPYALPYLRGRLGLVHGVRITDFNAAAVRPAPGEVELPAGKIVSDSGELIWEEAPEDGRVLIDAPRAQAVIMRAGGRATTNMRVDLATPFAAVHLASLEDRPISQASSLLLVAAARVANTRMKLFADDSRTVLGPTTVEENWGKPPARVEPVCATVTLAGLVGARCVNVQPLDGCGQPLGKARRATRNGKDFIVRLSEKPGTTWYLIEVIR